MTSTLRSPYFLQSQAWADFWLSAMEKNHTYHHVEYLEGDVHIDAYIYQYPWHLGQDFLYLPKGPVVRSGSDLAKGEILPHLRKFWGQVLNLAASSGATYIKVDSHDGLCAQLGITSTSELQDWLESMCTPDGQGAAPKVTIEKDTKTIQYLQTIILDGSGLSTPQSNSRQDLQGWFNNSKEFWSRTNQNIRRYTKKSLKDESLEIRIDKGEESFDAFWEVYRATATRQKFASHPKEYFALLSKEQEAHIINIYQGEKVITTWFGYAGGNTLTYLYGGNEAEGLAHKAQYLMHIAALGLMRSLGLDYYDLGGYDPSKGFGKFKEGYRGEERVFLGPVDIVLAKQKYTFTNRFTGAAKTLTGWIR